MSHATSPPGAGRAAPGRDVSRVSVPRTSVQRVEADGVRVFYRTAFEPGQGVIPHGPDRGLTVSEALPPHAAVGAQPSV